MAAIVREPLFRLLGHRPIEQRLQLGWRIDDQIADRTGAIVDHRVQYFDPVAPGEAAAVR
jgi:hypothetical protein